MTEIEEIDSWIGPESREPAATRPVENAMSWAMLIPIVLDLIAKRAEAGFPFIKTLIDRFRGKIVEDAEADTVVITVGAAPDELKNQLIVWLEAQKAKAGVGMKFVYAVLIRFVPMVLDSVWDNLFAMGKVGSLAADFPPTVAATAEVTEDDLLGL